MKKMRALIMLVLFVTIGLMVAQDSFATIYKYIDKDGLINFADDLQSVPVPYRAQAVIVSGEAKEQEIKKPESQVVPKTQLESHTDALSPDPVVSRTPSQTVPEVREKSAFSSRFMFSSIVVVSALFAFIILGIIDADHKKSIKITRMVILWGISVFLIYNHAMDVVHVFSSMGKSVVDAQHRSEEKGKKAARALKELRNAVEQAENPNTADPANMDPEKKE
jgi:hypothetical protein